jgi:hypothetical protein
MVYQTLWLNPMTHRTEWRHASLNESLKIVICRAGRHFGESINSSINKVHLSSFKRTRQNKEKKKKMLKTGYAYVAICREICVVYIRSTVAGQCAFCVGGSMMTKQWRHVRLIKTNHWTSKRIDEPQGELRTRERASLREASLLAWDERSHVISSVARLFLLDQQS